LPFSFHVALPSEFVKEGAPTRINISKSIEEDVLSHISQAFTTEDVFVVQCSPQAVFRVRPATRCSSTLSGVFYSYSHLHRLTVGKKGHASPILCASFSPTGNLLATGAGDCNARLWDLFTELPSHVLSGHSGWVLCVEWEGQERKLASGGHDGQVCTASPCFQTHLGSDRSRSEYGIQKLVKPLALY
jgi:ribosome assembly protein 4